MRIMKKFIYTLVMVIASLAMLMVPVKAATTLKVTTETLNLREKASTDSAVLTLLEENDTCELIEDAGDWYKVKYKTYTGYVTKEYVQKEKEDVSASNETTPSVNAQEGDNTTTPNNDEEGEITAKISKKTDVRLIPLIYSSKIDTLSKGTRLTILSEVNGWLYVQTDEIAGWIRNNTITDRKVAVSTYPTTKVSNTKTDSTKTDDTKTDSTKIDTKNDTNTTKSDINSTDNTEQPKQDDTKQDNVAYKEKYMYVNDSYVNVRKTASTSSEVIMVVEQNVKLTVIGEEGDWYKVKTSAGSAFIKKELLSSTLKTTSRGSSVNTIKPSSSTSMSTSSKLTEETATNNVGTSTSSRGQQIVEYAKQFLGVPYVYGGAGKSGFDCSGFTMYVYKHFEISMPHGAQSQSKYGKTVKVDKSSISSLKQNLQVGDLIFFLDYETMDEIGHCGIYVGNGKFIHASSGSGYCVKIDSLLPGGYYNTRYCAAKRVI